MRLIFQRVFVRIGFDVVGIRVGVVGIRVGVGEIRVGVGEIGGWRVVKIVSIKRRPKLTIVGSLVVSIVWVRRWVSVCNGGLSVAQIRVVWSGKR